VIIQAVVAGKISVCFAGMFGAVQLNSVPVALASHPMPGQLATSDFEYENKCAVQRSALKISSQLLYWRQPHHGGAWACHDCRGAIP